MARIVEYEGRRMEFPDDVTDEEIAGAFDPTFTERVGTRYKEAGQAMYNLPGALGRLISGEGGRLQAGLETVKGIAAPFEFPFAPIGEAARAGGRALAGPEGATVTAGGAELGVGPTELTQEQYGDIAAPAAEFGAALMPVGKGISGAARALKARRLRGTLQKGLDEPLKAAAPVAEAAAPAAEAPGRAIGEVLEGYKPPYIGQEVAPGGPLVSLDQPGKYAYNINLPRQLDHAGARQLMHETAQAQMAAGRYEELLGGPMNMAQLEDLASQSGVSLEKLLQVKPGEAWNKVDLLTARTFLGRSAHESFEAAQAFAQNPTAKTLDDVTTLMSRHTDIQESVSLLTNEWGRSGIAFKVQPKNINRLVEKAIKGVSGDLNVERVRALGMLDPSDPAFVNQVGTFLALAKKAKTRDKFFEAWVNGILSAPQTHVVNTVSNALVALTRPIETTFAAGFDIPRLAAARLVKTLGGSADQVAWLGGAERQVRFVDAFAEAAGIIQGAKEGGKAMAQAWKSGVPAFPTIGPGGKTIGKLEFTRSIGGKKGRLLNIPGRALIAGDEFFKGIAFRGTVNKMALRQAFKEAKAQPGLNIAQRAAEIGSDITIAKGMAGKLDELSMGIAKEAFSEAAYRTFQASLGTQGQALMNLRDKLPGARYIAPFMRTPINIAKYGLERTPLAVLYRGAQFAKGKAIMSEEWGRLALGSIVGGLFAAGVIQGTVTGAGPLERGKRRAQYGTGWQPYSVKIGDAYYQYGRFEPLGMVMGLAADFMEIAQRTPELEAEDTVWYISQAITQNLTNKTFLYGISNLLEAIYDPQRYGEDWAQRFVGSFVPAIVAHTGYALDPTLRTTPDIARRVQSRIPGMSADLVPFRDIWGEPVQFRTDEPALLRFLSPVRVHGAQDDLVAQEIRRLEPSVGSPRRQLGGLELEDVEYDLYTRRAGELARPRMQRLVRSGRYQRMADWEKVEEMEKTFAGARRLAANEVKRQKAYRSRSREQSLRRIKERAAARGGI